MQTQIKTFDNKIWDKQELLDNMYNDDFYYGYMGKNALSSSSAKTILGSPKTYYYTNKYGGSSASQALRDGKLFHTMILEPNKLDKMIFCDTTTKTTNKWKEAVMLGTEEGKEVYTTKERSDAERLTDALLRNTEVVSYFKNSSFEVPEVSMIDNIPFRAKADILGDTFILDLKTTSGINEFRYSANKDGYDLQAYLYKEMFGVDEFVFIAIDKGSLDIGIFECSNDFYNSGKEKLEQAISNYRYFFESDEIDLNQYVLRGIL